MDVRLALFLLLLGVILVALGAVWFDRWLLQRTHRHLVSLDSLRPLLDDAPYGLLLLDEPRHYRYANPHARRVLQLPPAPHALPADHWVKQLEEDRRHARAQTEQHGRYRVASIAGERSVRWWVVPWEGSDLAVLQDVSAQQRAAQGARFMMSDLSHELRTPLASLLTHLAVLRLPTLSDEQQAQSLDVMQGELERLSRLVQGVLDLGRLEMGMELEQHPLELRPLVEEVVAQLRGEAEGRAISLAVEGDTTLPPVIANRDRLRQLLLILLDNALKYSRPHDHVTIRLERMAEGVRCALCDTGPGIAAEAVPQLTRRFYRANVGEQIPGTGLGLSLAAEIARRHQSHLEIESRTDPADSGTCVSFVLPALSTKKALARRD